MKKSDINYAVDLHGVSKYFFKYSSSWERFLSFLGFVSPRYKFTSLSNIDFAVQKGECVGLIGLNGAGKSTLLNIMSGVLAPSQGSVNICGRVASILGLGIGFIPSMSGRENIYLYAGLLGLTTNEVDSKFQSILDFSELHDFIDEPVETYSSGMYARLAFSVVANVDADILIIDEALSVGDARFNYKCNLFIENFKSKGTVIFVSHSLDSIRRFCDRVVWLHKGSIKNQGSPKAICDMYYSYCQSGERDLNVESSSITTVKHGYNSFTTDDTYLQKISSFGFNTSSDFHGNGKAKIINADFHRLDTDDFGPFKSYENVVFKFDAVVLDDLDSPIVGFIIKDSLGQPLLGGNSFFQYENVRNYSSAGANISASFHFKLPILKVGFYSITAAIANGTAAQHEHVCWLHDVINFEVSESAIDGVICGVPITKIDFIIS